MSNEKNTIKKPLIIICLAVLASAGCNFIGISQASEVTLQPKHLLEQPTELRLAHDLKEVLKQEMMAIIPAIVAGNWESIAKLAQKIQGSFILK